MDARRYTMDIVRMSVEPQPQAFRLRFDRNEFSGAFGDMGTDLPLLVGMILAANLIALLPAALARRTNPATALHAE